MIGSGTPEARDGSRALFGVGIAAGVASLRRGPPRADLRAALWVTAPALAGLLFYLSAFTSLQLGVRYVLPVFPLLAVWLGGLAPRALELRSPRAAIVVGAVLAGPEPAVDYVRARALAIEGRTEEAEAVLAGSEDTSWQTLAYHVRLLCACGRPEEALERIRARFDGFEEEQRRAFGPTVEALERVVADRATLRRVLARVR